MKRSGNRRERPSPAAALIGGAAAASGAAIAENPVLVGSSTAFLVVLFYVSANALWNQPFHHPDPLIETRIVVDRTPPAPAAMPAPLPLARPAPTNEVTNSVTPSRESALEQAAPAPATVAPTRERTARVQQALKDLGLYPGAVDGLIGPQTRKAVSDYQKTLGMAETGTIDDRLIQALGLGPDRAASAAPPLPAPRAAAPAATAETVAALPGTATRQAAADAPGLAQAEIVKVQAGLRAFGNEAIEIDGVVGDKTRAAIREFQSLFGLQVTGEPDSALLAKMAEIGLTN
jgi:peptidoglycan hydrolase-like protein with peptidoglycan-binding domain